MKISPTLKNRFERNCAPGPSGCIEWTGCITNAGYGQISIASGISRGAHVVAWYLEKGYWPTAILHSCDNRKCVTVAHMQEGTKGDNNRDTSAKRRFHYATDHHNGVLTDQEVREIYARRVAGELGRELANEFGVSEAHISKIYLRQVRERAFEDELDGV